MHGGAWKVPRALEDPASVSAAREGLRAALEAGRNLLVAGEPALEAVTAAVRVLEDCRALNAGTGSVLNAAGAVELDAALMEGTARRAGAVTGVRRLVNPIEAARAVLQDGRHVLLAGHGAEHFARDAGIALVAPEVLIAAARKPSDAHLSEPAAGRDAEGTVGAVARDARGGLAAATSTGGTPGKLPGRVSDSALVGGGTWADDETCAVSATGDGDVFIRVAFARAVDARMRFAGCNLAAACAAALAEVAALGGSGGCIAVDRAGEVALAFNATGMLRGLVRAGEAPRVAVRPEDFLES
ncbi:MAG: isoaspartyl peptidase/L-asparaginase [Myxococcales bacterium]|nr:isoaspartyl peptidase/L-asparaginase [Myxococcales bacterium]